MKNFGEIKIIMIAALVLASIAGAQAQTDDRLVGEWHFDEGSGNIAKDSSGNGYDGIIHGATWVDGKFGKALSFDGVDDYITKPKMRVQVIIILPSGMSVTSSEFSKSGTNQFTANYELEPGDGKDIGVGIKPNQIGDFNVNGRIIYYFGDEKDKAEDQTLNLPIKVRKEPGQTAASPPSSNDGVATQKAPGFAGVIAIIGILSVTLLIRKRGT